ncbi:MAG: CDP-diacylglycerol--glycerol-3-phosphate 3-phosphatidyltransferase [Clostridiales bacterium]|jgi:CDP-diacylglycerol--glycerol-3-phosphate 3-phosphatidyltransferase|nr:CDP-diacylglycerol--glycerol-3-phosphate 3-phosphatidyltransferase [Clostridiales bacterium]
MTLPNKLTLLRIALVPFCLAFLLIDKIPHNYLGALIIFIGASVTDMVDGKIARKHSVVTTLGKFLDPLADKLLVCSVLICFVSLRVAPSVAVVIIVFREFAVSGLRTIAAQSGTVLAANKWGKMKTLIQMVFIMAIMLALEIADIGLFTSVNTVLMWCRLALWVAAAVTIVSAVSYFAENIGSLKL